MKTVPGKHNNLERLGDGSPHFPVLYHEPKYIILDAVHRVLEVSNSGYHDQAGNGHVIRMWS